MRLGRIMGVPVRLNPLALPMLGLALWLESGRTLALLTVCVALHEMGHMAAARLLRVRVVELELMPVGGAARLESVWKLRGEQLAGVALAGPAVNLLLLIGCLAAERLRPGISLSQCAQINAAIMMFNLLPALPLDGGRIVCGLLGRRISPAGAARVGVRLGMATGCGLLALAGWGARQGRLNLTVVMAGLFMLMTASNELREAGGAVIVSLAERWDELSQEGTLPVGIVATAADVPLSEALAALSPRRVHLFVCMDDEMRPVGWVAESDVLRAMLTGENATMGKLCERKGKASKFTII